VGARITGLRTNYPIGPYKVDVAFPDEIFIEVDGWAFHSDQGVSNEIESARTTSLLLGWQVLALRVWTSSSIRSVDRRHPLRFRRGFHAATVSGRIACFLRRLRAALMAPPSQGAASRPSS